MNITQCKCKNKRILTDNIDLSICDVCGAIWRDGQQYINRKQLSENMNDVLHIQGADGTWNYNQYMRGMYNGMVVLTSIVDNKEDPVFKDDIEYYLVDTASRSDLYKFKETGKLFDASQWFKNGDHPSDSTPVTEGDTTDHEGLVVRRYRNPFIHGNDICDMCGLSLCIHGWIETPTDGLRVCVGDYVITHDNGEYSRMSEEKFNALYEKVESEVMSK